jgi:hypothetical protein
MMSPKLATNSITFTASSQEGVYELMPAQVKIVTLPDGTTQKVFLPPDYIEMSHDPETSGFHLTSVSYNPETEKFIENDQGFLVPPVSSTLAKSPASGPVLPPPDASVRVIDNPLPLADLTRVVHAVTSSPATTPLQ